MRLRHGEQECRKLMVVFLMFILCILRCYSGACTQSSLSMSHNLLESVAKAKPANKMSIDKVKSNLEMILPYSFLNISHCVAFDISQEISAISGERSTAS